MLTLLWYALTVNIQRPNNITGLNAIVFYVISPFEYVFELLMMVLGFIEPSFEIIVFSLI